MGAKMQRPEKSDRDDNDQIQIDYLRFREIFTFENPTIINAALDIFMKQGFWQGD